VKTISFPWAIGYDDRFDSSMSEMWNMAGAKNSIAGPGQPGLRQTRSPNGPHPADRKHVPARPDTLDR
jgi:hypothetical protein